MKGETMSKKKTDKEVREAVKLDIAEIDGQTVIIKRYPEAGKRKELLIRCKG